MLAQGLLSRLFVFLLWRLQTRENQQGWKLVSAAVCGTGASIFFSSSNSSCLLPTASPLPHAQCSGVYHVLSQDDTQGIPVSLVRREVIKRKKALKALYNYRNTSGFFCLFVFLRKQFFVIVSLLHYHCSVDCMFFPLHSTDNFLSCHTSFL